MPETVLLVEDDPSLRRLVERLLAKFGYTVIVATGAEGAIARFTNSDIGVDLLITDVNMPGMRGPELAQRLWNVNEQDWAAAAENHHAS